jgi:electron transfer flavoprotein beta subunit
MKISVKILVAIKRVVDHKVSVRPHANGREMDLSGAKMAINPFCEIALEEAIRLKEQGLASEVVAVTIGSVQAQEQLRSALALGADRAILVTTDETLEPLAIAKCLRELVKREQPRLILLGKQSIDGDHNQVGQMLAGLCGYAQGTFASSLSLSGDELLVTRELDAGLETLALRLPAVVTSDLRLNQPRYATMPNVMKARQKPLETIPLVDFNLDIKPRLTTLSVSAPATRKAGVILASVAELAEKLRTEGGLI